jgi:hypothetical protein
MSVFMTMRAKGDGSKLEEIAANNPDVFPSVAERGRQHGALYHRMYASDDEILVVDVWSDEESFGKFFEASPEIGDMMAQAGVPGMPEIVFWRKLELNDDVG